MADEYSEEIRATLSAWVAELSASIERLEDMLGELTTRIDSLPVSQSKFDLERHRSRLIIETYKARRMLADV